MYSGTALYGQERKHYTLSKENVSIESSIIIATRTTTVFKGHRTSLLMTYSVYFKLFYYKRWNIIFNKKDCFKCRNGIS